MPQIRVLVVDDSSLVRRIVSRLLDDDKDFKVIDTAVNGEEAITKIQSLWPDVVTMDVEMPVMDGLTALSQIMLLCPVPVIMLSAHTTTGAKATMQALAMGAVDFVAKPGRPGEMPRMIDDLKYKIKVASQASVKRNVTQTRPVISKPAVEVDLSPFKRPASGRIGLVVIGSSTGGPAALQQVIPHLPASFPAGIVIVQHIPVGFSASLSDHLDKKARIKVKHAQEGDAIEPGQALVAPAGFDLFFTGNVQNAGVRLDPGREPVSPGGFRPSVDVVMLSAVEVFGNQVMGVLLTGMGRDGAHGMMAIRKAKGPTIAEHESTCVVYGMPRAAIEAGGAEKVAPINEIAQEIVRML